MSISSTIAVVAKVLGGAPPRRVPCRRSGSEAGCHPADKLRSPAAIALHMVCSASLLLTACTPREPVGDDEAEWADIQPITNDTADVTNASRKIVQSEGEDYAPLIRRLEEMVSVERAAGETMITGESLVFDYERRYVRLDEDVTVVDDRGVLETETLMGRFSEQNEVQLIEARKGVRIESEGRTATADSAVYNFASGAVQLDGRAEVAGEGNRLSGGQIKFWVKGSRKMICEPDARLEIGNSSALKTGGLEGDGEMTIIRSARLVYDEEAAFAEFDGGVELRDPRAMMDCGKARLYLKEGNEIDWIEALSEVIIQSEDRKALAGRAVYYAGDGRFVLEDEPKVMVDRNIMTGDRISFWHEMEGMVCEPNARLLLYPSEEMKAKFLKDLKD